MKRILIIIIMAVCLCSNADAQVFFGGELSKYKLNTAGNRNYRSITPSIGYQYHKLAFGMVFSYRKVYASHSIKDKAVELYPFIRYYYFKQNNLSLYIEANFAYSIHKTDYDNYSYHNDERYRAVYLCPGIQYHLSPRCAAVATLGLIGYSDSYWYGFKDFGCSFGLGASTLSFYYYFSKKPDPDPDLVEEESE